MMKSLLYKIILGSLLLAYTSTDYSSATSSLIKPWKEKEGFLIIADPVKIDKLDPTLSINAHTKFTLPLIYEPLVSLNPQQELLPILASSWSISTDHKLITITIKPHHYFSDGTEVTAPDIIRSVQRICSSESRISSVFQGLVGCEEHTKFKNIQPQAQVISNYQIIFKINTSPTTFLYQLASPSAVITKKTRLGLIGSGPYAIMEKTEDYVILNKNLFYANASSIKNTGIALFYVSPYKISILKTDEFDGAILYRMTDLKDYEHSHYKLIKSNPNITEILVFNNQKFPFNKLAVRRALSSTIYNNFIHSCISGAHKAYGIIPNGIGGSIRNMAPNFLPKITPQELFVEVPQLKNTKVNLVIHQLLDIKNDCETEQIIKAAKQYNIDIKFKYHKSYSTLAPLYLEHNFDAFIDLYIFKDREAYSILQFFTKSGKDHANIKRNPIDEMLRKASAESSSHRRFQAYREITKSIQAQSMVVPLFYMDHGNLMSKCLSGISDDFIFNPYLYLPQIYKMPNCKN